jgi:hypothetical protein
MPVLLYIPTVVPVVVLPLNLAHKGVEPPVGQMIIHSVLVATAIVAGNVTLYVPAPVLVQENDPGPPSLAVTVPPLLTLHTRLVRAIIMVPELQGRRQ